MSRLQFYTASKSSKKSLISFDIRVQVFQLERGRSRLSEIDVLDVVLGMELLEQSVWRIHHIARRDSVNHSARLSLDGFQIDPSAITRWRAPFCRDHCSHRNSSSQMESTFIESRNRKPLPSGGAITHHKSPYSTYSEVSGSGKHPHS